MKRIVLTYGLLSGAAAALLMVATGLYFRSAPDLKNGELFGYAGILLCMLFIFFGVKAYRDQTVEGERMSFGKAFQVGILISLISSVCYALAWMVVYETLIPDFMDKFAEHSLTQLRNSGADEARIQQETAKMEEFKVMYQNPLVRLGMTLLEPFPVGLVVTLVSALVLRRRKIG